MKAELRVAGGVTSQAPPTSGHNVLSHGQQWSLVTALWDFMFYLNSVLFKNPQFTGPLISLEHRISSYIEIAKNTAFCFTSQSTSSLACKLLYYALCDIITIITSMR